MPLCLLTPDMQNRRIIDRLLKSAGGESRPTLESDSMILLFTHVRTGRWASVMPARLAETLGLTDTIRAIPITAAGSGADHRPGGAGARADDADHRRAGGGGQARGAEGWIDASRDSPATKLSRRLLHAAHQRQRLHRLNTRAYFEICCRASFVGAVRDGTEAGSSTAPSAPSTTHRDLRDPLSMERRHRPQSRPSAPRRVVMRRHRAARGRSSTARRRRWSTARPRRRCGRTASPMSVSRVRAAMYRAPRCRCFDPSSWTRRGSRQR